MEDKLMKVGWQIHEAAWLFSKEDISASYFRNTVKSLVKEYAKEYAVSELDLIMIDELNDNPDVSHCQCGLLDGIMKKINQLEGK